MQSKRTGDLKITNIKFLKKKVKLILEDVVVEISEDTYTDYNFFIGKTLTNKEIRDIKNKDKERIYLNYALNLVSKASYTEKAISDKLIKKGASKRSTDNVIKYLTSYKLISDKEVISERVEYGNYMNHGKNKIRDDLYSRGVNQENISSLDFSSEEEYKKAISYLKKLNLSHQNTSFKDKKAKCYAFLINKGFDHEIASRVIDKLTPPSIDLEEKAIKEAFNKVKNRYQHKYEGDELKEKIKQYLLSKGYSYSLIKKIIGE